MPKLSKRNFTMLFLVVVFLAFFSGVYIGGRFATKDIQE